MSWTEQQNNAIKARGASYIVSAAAGSGKTAVLTERLIDLISDKNSGIRADRIVVVTFTNDAAAEMKKRLDFKLRALINERPDDQYLLKQQMLLQNAKISTINSFCFELLRDNMENTGVTTGFTVLDGVDNKVIKSHAMEELIEYYSTSEYEKISEMYDFFCIKDEKHFIEVIEKTDEFITSVAFKEKWLKRVVELYQCKFEDSVYYKALIDELLKKIKKAGTIAVKNRELIKKIFYDKKSAAYEKSCIQAEEDINRVSALIDILKSGRLPDNKESEYSGNFSTLVRAPKTGVNFEIRELFKGKREKIKKLVKKALSCLSSVESDYTECGRATRILVEMIEKYHEFIWKHKCQKNALSFDDGERLALELLADEDDNGNIIQSEAAKRISEYYDIIMIDEYQDSNNKQDMIFKLISKNFHTDESGEPVYGKNVFLVGDVKQSIYRFRLANPKNFISTLKHSVPYTIDESNKNSVIILNRNFRSSQQVIDFVNYIFAKIMTKDCGDIDYNEEEMLYYGAEYYNGNDSYSRTTHISFINDDSNDENNDEEIIHNKEAAFTANKIAQMIRSGVLVTERSGKTRKCRPSDFAILVRNNAFINAYANELIKIGIPAKGNEEKSYLRSAEISVLIDLLKIISNPMQDIPLASVMISPMYMFSISDLAQIRAIDTKKPLYSLLLGIENNEYHEMLDIFLTERCNEFTKTLASLRLCSVTMTLSELIMNIYDTTDFISVMQLHNDGEKKRANLRALIQYAKNFEQYSKADGTGGLSGFLQHLDYVMKNGDYQQGKISNVSGDHVTVQTIHGSKGLEYPFVFLAEMSVQFKFDSDIVMCSSDGKIGYLLFDPKFYRRYRTFQQTILSAEEERETRSEEMRLLYVAMTRAKEKLFINLKTGKKSIKNLNNIIDNIIFFNGDIKECVNDAKSFADWIWMCIASAPVFPEICEKIGVENKLLSSYDKTDAANIFEWEYIDGIKPDSEAETQEIKDIEADEGISSELRKIINHNYDMSLSETPAKLTVTQIIQKLKKDKEEIGLTLKRPRFKGNTSSLTGAERGTAIHTFFQYCSFEHASTDPEKEIENMKKKGHINEAEASSISISNVRAFFKNHLYKRILSSENYIREKKFMVAVSELNISGEVIDKLKRKESMIKGIIDLMFEENGEIVIVDYKSDRGADEKALRERYRPQLLLYKSAVELTTGKKVKETLLYSFELRKAIPVKV